MSLPLIYLQFFLFDACMQLLDSQIVLCQLLVELCQPFIFLLSFKLRFKDRLNVRLDHFDHAFLFYLKFLLSLVKLFCFCYDLFLLRSETVIYFSFFSLLLKQAYSLERSLTLNYKRSNSIQIFIIDLAPLVLGDVLVYSSKQLLYFTLLVDVHFQFLILFVTAYFKKA